MVRPSNPIAARPLLGGEGWGEGKPFSVKLRIFVVNETSLQEQRTIRRSVAMGREDIGV